MSAPRKNPLLVLLDGSFVLAIAATIIFYLVMHSPGMKGSWLHHYTTEHAVEYVVVGLSIWGVVDIIRKLLGFPRQILAVRHEGWLPERTGRESVGIVGALLEKLRQHDGWLRRSRLGRRYEAALQFVAETGSAAGLGDHLRLLEEQDAHRVHDSYTLVRFVIRVTPVLGFLGTVVHFGTALNGVSFDRMTDHLSVIVSEMGQAFNTTTTALASAMFMMFAQFACEWIDQYVLQRTDRIVEGDLLHRFEVRDAELTPFLAAVRTANEDALQIVGQHVDRQTGAWADAMERLFSRFDARQLEESTAWNDALEVLATRHEALDAQREQRLAQLLAAYDQRQEKLLLRIQQTIAEAATLRDGFGELLSSLDAIARGEGKLVELQATLAENLQLVRDARMLDDAVHQLTAAIHLLTARREQAPATRAAA